MKLLIYITKHTLLKLIQNPFFFILNTLLKLKKYEQAYALSKKINITEIDDESLFFIAEFYIIYEDYDLAMLYIKHIRLRLLLNKSSDVYKRIDYLMSLIP
ncbi:hypothetical protein [Escherichia coli]|uniref:hypothetical protein n=1 Tax=Escherichia coli TaxID=562 RepID=UPI0020331092|nr:hypothetical protein [Escherichia coli]